jgi:hypothetical protein
MPNPIKYSTGSETLALKKGNLYIGTGAVGKGPSETTGYYQGPNVPSGGYVIYMNKEGAPGNLSYHSAANDAQLISFTNSIAGQSYTGVNQCFDYYYSQNDKVLVNQDYPVDFPYIVLDGLVLYLDAGITQSYSGSGTTWLDINGLGPKNNGTLTNGPTYNSANGGSIVFDGVDDYINRDSALNVGNNFSVFAWVKPGNINIRNAIIGNSYPYNGRDGFLFATATGYFSQVNTFFISIGSDAAYGTTVDNVVNLNQWNYLGGTVFNGGENFKLYSNGVQKNLRPSSLLSSGTVTYNTNKLSIGARNPPSLLEPWIGNIAVTQMYNRILSDAEVLQNYNAQKGRFGL